MEPFPAGARGHVLLQLVEIRVWIGGAAGEKWCRLACRRIVAGKSRHRRAGRGGRVRIGGMGFDLLRADATRHHERERVWHFSWP